ncbi:hypothetical protein SAMN03080617_02021 [Algoriphagus alkaliphilus]|uniref:Uncharacterized protein n=1 Tax=Algoriphagus alkaliphilus TaxID=279824 RepID=A0A1G5XV27_9BACT|nr:hypothetical protein SAMN03080617_02021 [Algoriphagus alkaliphilus]
MIFHATPYNSFFTTHKNLTFCLSSLVTGALILVTPPTTLLSASANYKASAAVLPLG